MNFLIPLLKIRHRHFSLGTNIPSTTFGSHHLHFYDSTIRWPTQSKKEGFGSRFSEFLVNSQEAHTSVKTKGVLTSEDTSQESYETTPTLIWTLDQGKTGLKKCP